MRRTVVDEVVQTEREVDRVSFVARISQIVDFLSYCLRIAHGPRYARTFRSSRGRRLLQIHQEFYGSISHRKTDV